MTAPARRAPVLRAFHRPAAADAPLLIVFPHAGSGASAYRALSELLSAHFDVRIMQYPGRQDRGREAPATSLPELAAEAFAEFSAAPPQRPYFVFGHSMGSIVGFEFARLAEAAGQTPERLIVSSATAPSRVASLPPHPTGDDELLTHLTALDGTGGAVMGNEALMRMALPVLRADYAAFDAYDCAADARLTVPIEVIGGADDPVIPPHLLHSWNDHADDVTVSVVDGGHFHLNEHPETLVAVLAGVRA